MNKEGLDYTTDEAAKARRLAFDGTVPRAESDDYYQLHLIVIGHEACKVSAKRALDRLRDGS